MKKMFFQMKIASPNIEQHVFSKEFFFTKIFHFFFKTFFFTNKTDFIFLFLYLHAINIIVYTLYLPSHFVICVYSDGLRPEQQWYWLC